MSTDEIIEAYPYLESEDVRQCLRYAAHLADESGNRSEEDGLQDLFDDSIGMFRENWGESGERPVAQGMNVRLRYQTESGRISWQRYARVGPTEDGTMEIVFFPEAVALCVDEFRPAIKVEQIPFRTWPRGRENQVLENPDLEIQFLLTADDWETHKETLTALTQAVYKSWEASDSCE